MRHLVLPAVGASDSLLSYLSYESISSICTGLSSRIERENRTSRWKSHLSPFLGLGRKEAKALNNHLPWKIVQDCVLQE